MGYFIPHKYIQIQHTIYTQPYLNTKPKQCQLKQNQDTNNFLKNAFFSKIVSSDELGIGQIRGCNFASSSSTPPTILKLS